MAISPAQAARLVCVNVGTISEQMLYEIGDPQAYMLPDVTCDFSDVAIRQLDDDIVEITFKGFHPQTVIKSVRHILMSFGPVQ